MSIALFAACSSQKEITRDDPPPTPPTHAASTDTSGQTSEPFLPRPDIDFGEIAQDESVSLSERDPLLDRARLHIVLAGKSLAAGDTVTALQQCAEASERLDRASYLPEIDSDAGYQELLATLSKLYKNCEPVIARSDVEVPMSALQLLADESVETDSIDLTLLSFKEPPPTTIPLPLNEEVEKNIVYFTTKMRKHMVKWMERSGRYFPVMRPILKEEGMPDEIIYLTMIESGVNPVARSWAKCVGLWQFLKSTGEMYGLEGGYYLDDRCDPEKATRAAARHLRDLYNMFDDWHLALAAYNAGAGRISRAIKKSGKQKPSYWDIRPLLPKETQNYVPRYIAVSIIALDAKEYSMDEVPLQPPLEYDVVPVEKPYHVKDLAEGLCVPVENIQELNPMLLQGVTPPQRYGLRIPKGSKDTFAQALVNIKPFVTAPAGESITGDIVVIDYKVKRGDTFNKIARKHKVTVSQLLKANELAKSRPLKAGEVLRVPHKEIVKSQLFATAVDNVSTPKPDRDPAKRTEGRSKLTIRVDKGMTLGGIADYYGVTVHDLIRWNSMSADQKLLAGATLNVWIKDSARENTISPSLASATTSAAVDTRSDQDREAPQAVASATVVEYKVQRGETLASIADAFNVTIQNLIEWNELKNTRVKSGSTLKIKSQPSPSRRTVALRQGGDEELTQEEPRVQQTTPARDTVHVVKKGETLFGIAALHGLTVKDMMRWNGLANENIVVGQQLALFDAQKNRKPAAVPETVKSASTAPSDTEKKIVVSAPTAAAREKKTDAPAQKPVTVKQGTPPSDTESTSLAAASKSETPTTTKEASAPVVGSYTVKPGDNLSSIARTTGVNIHDLRAWNKLSDDNLKPGQTLQLRGARDAAPVTVASAGDASRRDTIVRSGGREIAVVKHTVKKGDNLYSIAREYGITVSDLKKWNKLKKTALSVGEELEIRDAQNVPSSHNAKPVTQGAKSKPTKETVQSAAKPETTPAAVETAGEKTVVVSGASKGTIVKREHVVQSGETLYSIAKTLGVTVEDMRKWNSIGAVLKTGQTLVYYTSE